MVLRFKGVFSCHKRQIRGRTDAPSYIPVTSIEFRQQLRRTILAADKHHTFYMSSPHKPSIEIDYKKHTMKNQKSYRASCRKLQVKSPTVAHSNHLYHCIPLESGCYGQQRHLLFAEFLHKTFLAEMKNKVLFQKTLRKNYRTPVPQDRLHNKHLDSHIHFCTTKQTCSDRGNTQRTPKMHIT